MTALLRLLLVTASWRLSLCAFDCFCDVDTSTMSCYMRAYQWDTGVAGDLRCVKPYPRLNHVHFDAAGRGLDALPVPADVDFPYTMDARYNKISRIKLETDSPVESLKLDGNPLRYISGIVNLSILKRLSIANCNLTTEVIGDLKSNWLEQLEYLDVSHNQIDDLSPLRFSKSILKIDARNNAFTNVNLDRLLLYRNAQRPLEIDLRGNELLCSEEFGAAFYKYTQLKAVVFRSDGDGEPYFRCRHGSFYAQSVFSFQPEPEAGGVNALAVAVGLVSTALFVSLLANALLWQVRRKRGVGGRDGSRWRRVLFSALLAKGSDGEVVATRYGSEARQQGQQKRGQKKQQKLPSEQKQQKQQQQQKQQPKKQHTPEQQRQQQKKKLEKQQQNQHPQKKQQQPQQQQKPQQQIRSGFGDFELSSQGNIFQQMQQPRHLQQQQQQQHSDWGFRSLRMPRVGQGSMFQLQQPLQPQQQQQRQQFDSAFTSLRMPSVIQGSMFQLQQPQQQQQLRYKSFTNLRAPRTDTIEKLRQRPRQPLQQLQQQRQRQQQQQKKLPDYKNVIAMTTNKFNGVKTLSLSSIGGLKVRSSSDV